MKMSPNFQLKVTFVYVRLINSWEPNLKVFIRTQLFAQTEQSWSQNRRSGPDVFPGVERVSAGGTEKTSH